MGTGKRGGGDLAQQIASLKSRMTEDQVATATKLAEKQPEAVIRYAVKLISANKPQHGGLTKREQGIYASLCKKDQAVADSWKADTIAAKAKKSK